MSVRIRLQKKGKKRYKVYRIVVANSKSPRDGKVISKLGFYNPNLKKKKIIINLNKVIYWIKVGARPNKKTKILLQKHILIKKILLKNKIK
ncbi:MAG: 30S ribosomal protein S16 [Candidatus Shikimatogenerans sp. Tduv]|uniref:Small ribosomal subunit protein bS16 n=1 Tax=Candidatus Shikimatogenerans sp. Tduv TaxID=3158567 RepID=A0AAU7QU29_9FLAO